MSTTTTSIWRTAVGVFIGVSAATIAERLCDEFLLQQQINKATHEINEAARQRHQAEDEAQRQLFRKQANDEAADDRIRKKLDEELANRASQPIAQPAR